VGHVVQAFFGIDQHQPAVDFQRGLIEQAVGGIKFAAAVSGLERRQAFWPAVVAAFDFASGLPSEDIATMAGPDQRFRRRSKKMGG
jgi:hypothetical protein